MSTLTRLHRHLGLATTDTADDARLRFALETAASGVERVTGRHFTPRRATLKHTVGRETTTLILTDDLLSLESLADAGGMISLASILTLPANSPASALQLTGGRAFLWADTPTLAVSVTGIWGWHDDWAQAWAASGDTVQNNPLSSSATTLTVTDAEAGTPDGETPRFQVGHLLNIENEYLRVLAVNTVSNQLTVERGANGTTAAGHVLATPIAIYRPPRDVEMVILRWATWLARGGDSTAPAPLDEITSGLAPLRRPRV